jgi:hypothetical protein
MTECQFVENTTAGELSVTQQTLFNSSVQKEFAEEHAALTGFSLVKLLYVGLLFLYFNGNNNFLLNKDEEKQHG